MGGGYGRRGGERVRNSTAQASFNLNQAVIMMGGGVAMSQGVWGGEGGIGPPA
jgi:hypothetical protein